MAEHQTKVVEGVEVETTGNRKWTKNYALSDVQTLFRRGDWQHWDDALHWLEHGGAQDNELTPGQAVAMKEDLERLKRDGVPFRKDPASVYQEAHAGRQSDQSGNANA